MSALFRICFQYSVKSCKLSHVPGSIDGIQNVKAYRIYKEYKVSIGAHEYRGPHLFQCQCGKGKGPTPWLVIEGISKSSASLALPT